MRLIDADEAIDVLKDALTVPTTVQKWMEEAKEKKRAHWIDAYGGRYANPKYICSVCKKPALYIFKRCELGNWAEEQALSNYCPHCGREMTNGGVGNG